MAARKQGPVATAVAAGDQRAALEAIRDDLARRLDRIPAGSASAGPISLQLRQTLKDLAALPARKEGSKLDEVRARREARRGAAATTAPGAGRGGG